jgi:beta-galactosidase
MLSKDVAEGVKRYVREGGTAVSEARLAWNDERGFSSEVIPGFGLAEVFGAREKVIRPVERPEILVEATAGLPGLIAGEKVLGEAYEEDLEPLAQARVLARFTNHEPAVVEQSFGKGKGILMGTFLALACQRHPEESAKRLLVALARAAGVNPAVRVTGEGTAEVDVRRLVSDQFQIIFAFNHAEAPADSTISVRLPWPASRALDLTSNESVALRANDDTTEIHLNLKGGEIRVLRIAAR